MNHVIHCSNKIVCKNPAEETPRQSSSIHATCICLVSTRGQLPPWLLEAEAYFSEQISSLQDHFDGLIILGSLFYVM